MVLNVFWKHFIKLPIALLMAKCMFRDKARHYILICDHIGDFIIAMGYLDAYKSEHQVPFLTVCTTPKLGKFCKQVISNNIDILEIAPWKLQFLLALNSTHFTNTIVEQMGNVRIVEPSGYFTCRLFSFMLPFPDVTLRNLIQYGCLRLSPQAQFSPFPYVAKKEYQPRKKVLFCPGARVTELTDQENRLFYFLVEHLSNLGFELYTNLGDPQDRTITGTNPAALSLEKFGSWLEPDDWVIGLRSGLMDYLAYLPCNMICLYPHNSRHMRFFTLDMLPSSRASYTEIRLSSDMEKNVQDILGIVKIQ